MEQFNFTAERDKALYEAYKAAIRRPDVHSHQQAIITAINSPTTRYWISTFQAYREMLKMKKGKPSKGIRSVRRVMLDEIYEIYKNLASQRAFQGSSTFFITSFAVQREAPRFFISYYRALTIIQNMKHKKNK